MKAEVRQRIRPTFGNDRIEIVTDADCEIVVDNGKCFVVRKPIQADSCGDNRFEVIEKAKVHLLKSTNIEDSPKEMEVINNILSRCWQMGWLKQYEL